MNNILFLRLNIDVHIYIINITNLKLEKCVEYPLLIPYNP